MTARSAIRNSRTVRSFQRRGGDTGWEVERTNRRTDTGGGLAPPRGEGGRGHQPAPVYDEVPGYCCGATPAGAAPPPGPPGPPRPPWPAPPPAPPRPPRP